MSNETSNRFIAENTPIDSYYGGVGRIVGLLDYDTFKFPQKIIERRKQFWDNFFRKYSTNIKDKSKLKTVTLKPRKKKKKRTCNASSTTQYWVNTGYLSHKKKSCTNEDKQSHSFIRRIKSQLPVQNNIQPNCNNNSSSSSVETAAEIIDITEAKNDTVTSSQNTQNMEITETVPDKMCVMNNENIVLNNSCKSSTLYESLNKNSSINQNLSNMKLSHREPNYLAKENFMSDHSIETIGHRKKLYSGRDSPVDLINMESSNEFKIYDLKQNLHPAFNFGCNLSKKKYICKKKITNNGFKDRKSRPNINKTYGTRVNLTKNDTLSLNNNPIKDLVIDHSLVEYNTDQQLITSLPINESTSTNNNFDKSINNLKKTNTKKNEEPNNVIEKFINISPVVLLTLLSKDDIEKYTKSKKIMKNLTKLNIIQLPKFENNDCKKQNKLMTNIKNWNPTVLLTRLSIFDIQKHKKPNNMLVNLNPMVRLKRLSEFEIQKYKKSGSVVIDIGNLGSEQRFIEREQQLNGIVINKAVEVTKISSKHRRDVYQHVKNSVLSFDEPKIISENSCSNNSSVYKHNKKERSLSWNLSDEDDEFVKLIHCPKKIQESKLKLHRDMLNRNFNSPINKFDNYRFDRIHNSMKCLQQTEKGVIKSTDNQLFSESIIKDFKFQNQEDYFSPMTGNYNQELKEAQAIIKNQAQNLSDVNITKNESKSNSSRLCFKSKGFFADSDSESFTESHCSFVIRQ